MSSPSRAKRGVSRWAATATRRSDNSSSDQFAASSVARCLTSTNASTRPRRATRSTSPPGTRTRCARILQPRRRSHQAAIASACVRGLRLGCRLSRLPLAQGRAHRPASWGCRAGQRRPLQRETGSSRPRLHGGPHQLGVAGCFLSGGGPTRMTISPLGGESA